MMAHVLPEGPLPLWSTTLHGPCLMPPCPELQVAQVDPHLSQALLCGDRGGLGGQPEPRQ